MAVPLVQKDTKPSLTFLITDDDGVAIDLTNHAVNFFFKKMGAAALTNLGHTLCVLSDPTNGYCRYDWGANDLAVAGLYEGELEITYSDSSVQTVYSTWQFQVRPEVEV
jgi:hypothetical protein